MAPPPRGCFVGSGSPSGGGGGRMLSFSSASNGDAGIGYGSSDVTSMHGVLARVRGVFTPTQWMELEHQALIYKHIAANAPVPAGLLLPIRRAHPFSCPFSLHPPAVFPHLWSGGTLGSSSLGWGSLQTGYSGSADLEPGRCRRTDGKKWRCSRDAVVDQKYCERHINRGRHRSRKHVEGVSSHGEKAMIAISQPALCVSNGKSSGSHGVAPLLAKNLPTNLTDHGTTQFGRNLLDKVNVIDHVQDSTNQQYMQGMSQNKNSINSYEETSSHAEYTTSSTGALMNVQRSENVNLCPQQPCRNLGQPDPVHHFVGEEIHSDGIQLSISSPTDNSSLPNNYHQAQIDLAVDGSSNDGGRASWIPVSWETSTDGPLGEFFSNTSNALDNRNKICHSPFDLSTDGCTTGPQLRSPTRVLQMTNFSSVSSSTVSSPGNLCNSMLPASLLNS